MTRRSDHTIRLHRRWWRRISLECQECQQCLASGRSNTCWLTPETLWRYEQVHRREADEPRYTKDQKVVQSEHVEEEAHPPQT